MSHTTRHWARFLYTLYIVYSRQHATATSPALLLIWIVTSSQHHKQRHEHARPAIWTNYNPDAFCVLADDGHKAFIIHTPVDKRLAWKPMHIHKHTSRTKPTSDRIARNKLPEIRVTNCNYHVNITLLKTRIRVGEFVFMRLSAPPYWIFYCCGCTVIALNQSYDVRCDFIPIALHSFVCVESFMRRGVSRESGIITSSYDRTEKKSYHSHQFRALCV